MVTQLFGVIDFSSDSIPIEILKALYEYKFPYLELTEKGKTELYGGVSQEETPPATFKPKKKRS